MEQRANPKINILMVDDRPENLLALEAVLIPLKYNLIKTSSGEEALKWILKEEFAIILLDVQMPGMDGFETAKFIKTREKSKNIPIIFITAINQANEFVNQGYSVGAIDYIFKPFNPDALRMKVEGFIKLYKSQKRLEKLTLDLQKAEKLARIISETSINTIITTDAKGDILKVNPAIGSMLGYEIREVIGKHFTLLLSPVLFFKNSKIQTGFLETEVTRKNNTSFPAEVHISAAEVGNEKIFILSIRDITERKLIELEKRRHILESITDAFIALDRDWCFTYLNKAAEILLNKKAQYLIGKSIMENFIEINNSKFQKRLTKCIIDRTACNFEIFYKGIQKWFEFNVYPSKEGLSIYFRDITEKKQSEEKIRLSEELFSKIFNASPVLIEITKIKDKTLVDVNTSWLTHMGYSKEEVIGRSLLELEIPVDRDSYKAYVNNKTRCSNITTEYRTKLKDIRTALLSNEIIEINGEECRLSVLKDITEIKRFEEEMARLDRLNLIGEMAAAIGHEIRNPLTTVRGFLQLLQKKDDPLSYYELMIDELDRANSIITEFLSLAKNRKVKTKKCNLNSIVDAISPLILADALKSNKELIVEKKLIPELIVNENEIRQLLYNLCRNGLDAMDSKDGKLKIKTYAENEHVVLSVQDDGYGIKPEVLRKLGTPFYTTKDNGTGLGLAICYSIAARHNASIEIESSSKGTNFNVCFKC